MNSNISKREINTSAGANGSMPGNRAGNRIKCFVNNSDWGWPLSNGGTGYSRQGRNPTINPVPVAFLPVSVKEQNLANLTVVVNDNNLRIEIPADFNPTALRKIIEVLRAS